MSDLRPSSPPDAVLPLAGPPWHRRPAVRLAGVVLMAAAVLGAGSVAGVPVPAWLPVVLLAPLLPCWLAFRHRSLGAATSAGLLALAALLAKVASVGPFASATPGAAAAMLAGCLAGLVALPLLAAALAAAQARAGERWQRVFDASRIGVGEWDLRRARVRLSARWLDLLDRAGEPGERSLEGLRALLHPDDAPSLDRALDTLRGGVAESRIECRMASASGAWRPLELHALVAERGPDGRPRRVVLTARDISDLQAARAGERLSQSVLRHLHEGLLITDAQHRVVEANPCFCELSGYRREALLGQPLPLLQAPREPALAAQLAEMAEALDAAGTWRGEFHHRRPDGSACVLQLTVTAVRDAEGRILNHVVAAIDVTDARAQLAQLQRQAHYDELTRLPNRARLAQMLQAALATSRREGSLLTVCCLDLDHFKPVNERFGHEAGDRLLIEVATRMRRTLRSWAGGDDVVARIGGDEFVLLLRTATLEESRHAVERVLGQVGQPCTLGDASVLVTASIGATVFPFDAADAETLLRHADHAMYGAKQAGRNGYLFFDAEHDRRAEARFVALGRVQEALDAGEFRLYFQPKVDMRHARVLGVEALLRWKHPEHGVISPAQFLPLIENTGLSIAVGNWVLQQGIEQAARWQRMGIDLSVSINVSARHLQEPLFAQHLAGLLSRHDVPVAHRLIIEVLETAALADIDYTCGLMEECRALGVRFALDDFGTGYSTFTYLKRLPIDLLKIDRSFVINMLADRQDLAIVEGVIGLSQTFGCTVVAEGVETPAQAERLIEIGCDVGQGNGIAAAMPAEQVPDWVLAFRGIASPAAPAPPAEQVVPV